jgi:cell shape-determining protein MreC
MMENVQIAQLWKRAKESDAPAWLSELVLEIKRVQARLEVLEQENATLAEQLASYRSLIAA